MKHPLLFAVALFTMTAYMPLPAGAWRESEVPLYHPVYRWMDRMAVQCPKIPLHTQNKPFRWRDVELALNTIRRAVLEGELMLPSHDRDRLERFLREFTEFHRIPAPAARCTERHVFTHTEEDLAVIGDLELVQHLKTEKETEGSRKEEVLSSTSLGVLLRGSLWKRLHWFLNAKISRIQGNEPVYSHFNASEGLPFNAAGNTGGFQDWTEGNLYLPLPFVQISAGKSNPVWGPGYRGQLTLSSTSPSFNNVRIRFTAGSVMFTALHGWLRGDSSPRYIVGHRIDWRVRPQLHIGLSETVVYGGRGVELEYLIPVNVYHFSEHYLGDRDNNTISSDVSLTIAKRMRIYGEIFIDDFNTSKNFTTWWGNKWAYIGGIHLVHSFREHAATFRFEGGRVEPWVYTHDDTYNVYTHFDSSLGLWLGPDSRYLFTELRLYPFPRLAIGSAFERDWNGAGDIFTPHTNSDGAKKHFLEGTVERVSRLSLSIDWEPVQKFFVTTEFYTKKTENYLFQDGITARFHGGSLRLSFEY
jgi:hypothetical protein